MAPLTDAERGGLYYDQLHGEFCRLDDTSSRVLLLVPNTSDIYYEMSEGEWEEERGDFVRVDDEAVENPIHHILDRFEDETIEDMYAVRQLQDHLHNGDV